MKALDKALLMILSMQIRRLLQGSCFEHKLNSVRLAACQPFASSGQGFGDNTRGKNYKQSVGEVRQLGYGMFLKIQFLYSHLGLLQLGCRERLNQGASTMEHVIKECGIQP